MLKGYEIMSFKNRKEEITLSFITVNFNGLKDTCALIDSIPSADGIEIIVVDNGSSNDEATILKHRYPHIITIRSKQNLGFAGGNNLGIKASRGYYLFFINNDTIIKGNNTEKIQSLEAIISRLDSSQQIGVVCPKLRFFWNDNPIQFAGFTTLSHLTLRNRCIGFGEQDFGQYDTPHPTPYAHGAAMIVRRKAIEQAGVMPDCYFLYYEELDWSIRIRKQGYEIWYDPACTIYHKESQTTGQDSPLRTYYFTRNRLLFARRNCTSPSRYLTYLYLIGIVYPRDIIFYFYRWRIDLVKAATKGILAFLKGQEGNMNEQHSHN